MGEHVLLLRADAGDAMGMGHIMRCLALAQAWRAAGGACHLLTGAGGESARPRWVVENVDVTPLRAARGSEEDAAETAGRAMDIGASWVVVDGYHFGSRYQEVLKEKGRRLLAVDDYGHASPYHADLVLNQNAYATDAFYEHRGPGTRLLLGTSYLVLRKEFWPYRGWRRRIPSVARQALISMGGEDPRDFARRAIEAVGRVSEPLDVRVVVGPAYRHGDGLRCAAGDLRSRVTVVENAVGMAEHLAWADIAVLAGGTTSWEAAFLGLPSVTVALAENQKRVVEALASAGAALDAGWHEDVNADQLASSVEKLAADEERRTAMCRAGQELVDGNGVFRVVERMWGWGDRVQLRRVSAADCRTVWTWANDEATRAQSFNGEPIPWDQHCRWFDEKRNSPDCRFFLAEDSSGAAVGCIRYDLKSGDEGTVSINVAPTCRGGGLGTAIIRQGTYALFAGSKTRAVHAYIKPGNTGSIKAFMNAGYRGAEDASVRGCAAKHLVRTRGEPA